LLQGDRSCWETWKAWRSQGISDRLEESLGFGEMSRIVGEFMQGRKSLGMGTTPWNLEWGH